MLKKKGSEVGAVVFRRRGWSFLGWICGGREDCDESWRRTAAQCWGKTEDIDQE